MSTRRTTPHQGKRQTPVNKNRNKQKDQAPEERDLQYSRTRTRTRTRASTLICRMKKSSRKTRTRKEHSQYICVAEGKNSGAVHLHSTYLAGSIDKRRCDLQLVGLGGVVRGDWRKRVGLSPEGTNLAWRAITHAKYLTKLVGELCAFIQSISMQWRVMILMVAIASQEHRRTKFDNGEGRENFKGRNG